MVRTVHLQSKAKQYATVCTMVLTDALAAAMFRTDNVKSHNTEI